MKNKQQIEHRLEHLKQTRIDREEMWREYGNIPMRINDWEGNEKENHKEEEMIEEIEFLKKALKYLFQ